MTEYRDSNLESDSNMKMTTGGSVATAAQAVNPATEEAYWREHYGKSEYAEPNRSYADYHSAYKYGWESHARLGNRPFEENESALEQGWEKAKGNSKLAWTQAKRATQDAWHRLERAVH